MVGFGNTSAKPLCSDTIVLSLSNTRSTSLNGIEGYLEGQKGKTAWKRSMSQTCVVTSTQEFGNEM